MFVFRSSSIIVKIPKCFHRLKIASFHHLSGKQVCQKDLPKIMVCTRNQHQNSDEIKKEQWFKPLYKKDKIDPHCELIFQYGQDVYYWSMLFHTIAIPACVSSAYSFVKEIMSSEFYSLSLLIHPANILFSIFITIWINKMMRRFLNRIYYDPFTKTYTAIHVDWNFKFQKLEFTPEDCEIMDNKYGRGNLQIKDKKFSVNPSFFKYQRHFENIFGIRMIPKKDEESDK